MKWILIMIFVGYKSSSMTNIEFDSLIACEFAAKTVEVDFRAKAVCVPKDK